MKKTQIAIAMGGLLLGIPSFAQQAPPVAAPLPARSAPAPLLVPSPHYVSITMTIDVNAPIDKVWGRIGKYCDIAEWGIPNCSLLSGTDGEFGAVRSIGNEVLVGKTKYSYTYTQPVRVGVPYNLYHGTLAAEPVKANITRLNYTLFFDNSMLADDAARDTDIANRRTRFTKMLDNMKTLAEGGTLPEGALGIPPEPVALRPDRCRFKENRFSVCSVFAEGHFQAAKDREGSTR